MSETPEAKKSKRSPDEGDTREKSAVEPIPKNEPFFQWLQALFYTDPEQAQFPERIEVRPASGKKYERLNGPILQRVWPPKAQKPTTPQIVAMSNEILFRCQQDCDIQRRQVVYCVGAVHFNRSDDFFERWLLRMMPTAARRGDGEPREDSDEDDTAQGKFSKQVFEHGEKMFENYTAAYEGLLDRFDRDKERDHSEIGSLRDENHKLREQVERALSLDEDRQRTRAWDQLKIQSVQKGLDMGMAILPPLVNQLAGKQVLPTNDSLEAVTLRNFLKLKAAGGSLTEDQAKVLFGDFEDGNPERPIKAGIFTVPQTQILMAVAHCAVPPDELDKLLPGSPLEVTADQFASVMSSCDLTLEQVAPLRLIFDSRAKRRGITTGDSR